MTALIVIAVIIFAIMMITIGVDADYVDGQLSLSAVFCGIKIKILPKKEKDPSRPEKPKKEKPPKPIKKNKKPVDENAEPKKKKLSFSFDEIIELLNRVIKAIGRFNRKIRVGRFMLHYTGGGDDPYKTAMTYGYLNAGIATLAPACRKSFLCHDYDILTQVDFSAEKTLVDFGIRVTLRIGSIFAMINSIAFGALGILIRNKIRLSREKRADEKAENDSSEAELNQTA